MVFDAETALAAKFASLAPPYSLVLIADEPRDGQIPIFSGEQTVVSTTSCISVACRAEVDGDTDFTLGLVDEVNPGRDAAFAGILETPNRKIAIRTVENEIVLEVGVEQRKTNVWVWVNHPSEPDDVIVGIS